MVMHVIAVAKFLPTNITETSILSIQDVWIKVTVNFHATCAHDPLRNATAYAFTYYMCTKSIGHTSVLCAAKVLVNRLV